MKKAVGIDDMAIHIPSLYLPISTLAETRSIDYDKLNKGLGLIDMALADAHEDAATMAANAVLQLILKNNLHPRDIGRIYMGTESAVDGSKPMASYVLEMLSTYFTAEYGPDCLLHTDVVDLTFACIGSIDAMHNSLDWIRAGEGRMAIIVGSDVAKYELESTGEYTQGAGAVALLLKEQPRVLAISKHWGVATRGVHDFFKPMRKLGKQELIQELLRLSGQEDSDVIQLIEKLEGHLARTDRSQGKAQHLTLYKETPVFDGQFSNDCYQQRISEALQDFAAKAGLEDHDPVIDQWDRLVFHLPYAYQARRMFSKLFVQEAKKSQTWEAILAASGLEEPQPAAFKRIHDFDKANAAFLRQLSKTKPYLEFVEHKISKGEWASSRMGNLYTSSIFLALMSTLEADLHQGTDLEGRRIGFFGYGSGSKSKVFEGVVQAGWREMTQGFKLMDHLDNRTPVSYATYEQLHTKSRGQSVMEPTDTFYLAAVCMEKGVLEGARTYKWMANPLVAV